MRVPGSGFTLLEVMVALAIMSLIVGMSGLALASLTTPREAETIRTLREARSNAIRTGHTVRAGQDLFLPDGRALGPGVDPLTGVPRDSAR